MQPNSKVTDGAIAGALMAVLLWMVADFGHVVVPPEAAAGMTVLITFAVSYALPERRV